jgi:serine/threonine protein kinase
MVRSNVVGSTISHFDILQRIGQGGMGIVYRALDKRLNRIVAIKVLPPDAVRDPERQPSWTKRFLQEAQAASALNHPNIVTIYEIDTFQGLDFIVMEYISGKTLDALIRHKPMPVPQALKLCAGIVDALGAAHDAGIVHRDLKPSNIMITDAGAVKVLDFGMAKVADISEPVSPAGAITSSDDAPTVTLEFNGKIVGTAPYMSPEHIQGKDVDARSDIFSFGAVLYEMVTGQRAFAGASKSETVAAVLQRDPTPASQLVKSVPRQVERLIARCLHKHPARRFQSVSDLKVGLEDLRDDVDPSRSTDTVTAPLTAAHPRSRLGLGIAIVIGILGILGLTWMVARPPAQPQPSPPIRLTSDAGLSTYPALSPDGKFVAYASDRGAGNLNIWLQQVGGGAPIRLTKGDDDDHEPSFSPDGTRIVFRSERDHGGIYVISALGGDVRKIAPEGRDPRFSPDGTRVAYWLGVVGGDVEAAGAARIFVVPAGGGTPTEVQPSFASARYPVWLADSRHLLFTGSRDANGPPAERSAWWIAPVDGGPAIRTGAYDLCRAQGLKPYPGSWTVDDNRLIFSASAGDSTDLWELTLTARDWKVAAGPKRLTFGASDGLYPSFAAGRLAFASPSSTVHIWMLPLSANRTTEPRQLTSGAADDTQASLSSDGKTLTYISYREGNYDIWLKNLVTGRDVRLLETRENEYYPTLSPDGSRLAFYTERDGKRTTYVMHTTGGAPEKICEDCGTISSWSADNRHLLYIRALEQPRRSIGVLEVATGQKTAVLEHPQYNLYQPVYSPDGRWIAFYARITPSRNQMFVAQPHTPPQQWIPITDGSTYDLKPRWSPEGSELYFFSERDRFRCIWAQGVDRTTRRPVSAPRAVCHFHSSQRPLMNVAVNALGLAVAADKIVFNLLETHGNIWLTDLK